MSRREVQWAEWMRAANSGSAPAYDRLLRDLTVAFRGITRRGFARAGRTPNDVEDVVQEILLAVHLKRHTWDATQPFGPWIGAIARHKLVDALRRRGNRFDVPIEDFSETLPAEEPSQPDPKLDVRRHLDKLSERQREVVRAIALDGVSIGETAGRLKISPGAVRVALHRGLASLAVALRTSEP